MHPALDKRTRRALGLAGAGLMALALGVGSAAAAGYKITPLATDDQSVLASLGYGAAPVTDPNLLNPWGFDHSATGPWVVANTAGSGTLTSYTGTGKVVGSAVTVTQNGGGGPAGPTGLVYAGGDGFKLPSGGSGQYFAVNLDGSISGWDGVSGAAQQVVPGRTGGNIAAYTGLAVASSGGQNYLYAANNITGNIDVYNTSLQHVSLAGNFVDPGANPLGLAAYNVQTLDGHIWITYAVPGPSSDDQPLGSGFVSEFNTDGTFVQRFADGGGLSSPWGIVIAPSDFGAYSNDVLIGNFNDDTRSEAYISAYNATTGQFEGTLNEKGAPITLPGLWGLEFGNGGAAGATNTLYFVAGIGDENHGLFGSISAVPEPGTWALMIGGFGLVGASLRRRNALAAAAA